MRINPSEIVSFLKRADRLRIALKISENEKNKVIERCEEHLPERNNRFCLNFIIILYIAFCKMSSDNKKNIDSLISIIKELAKDDKSFNGKSIDKITMKLSEENYIMTGIDGVIDMTTIDIKYYGRYFETVNIMKNIFDNSGDVIGFIDAVEDTIKSSDSDEPGFYNFIRNEYYIYSKKYDMAFSKLTGYSNYGNASSFSDLIYSLKNRKNEYTSGYYWDGIKTYDYVKDASTIDTVRLKYPEFYNEFKRQFSKYANKIERRRLFKLIHDFYSGSLQEIMISDSKISSNYDAWSNGYHENPDIALKMLIDEMNKLAKSNRLKDDQKSYHFDSINGMHEHILSRMDPEEKDTVIKKFQELVPEYANSELYPYIIKYLM